MDTSWLTKRSNHSFRPLSAGQQRVLRASLDCLQDSHLFHSSPSPRPSSSSIPRYTHQIMRLGWNYLTWKCTRAKTGDHWISKMGMRQFWSVCETMLSEHFVKSLVLCVSSVMKSANNDNELARPDGWEAFCRSFFGLVFLVLCLLSY